MGFGSRASKGKQFFTCLQVRPETAPYATEIRNTGRSSRMLKALSEHHLVPQHELLKKDEAKNLLAQFGLDIDKLPRISLEDPMCTELKAGIGDVIRIVRRSPVAGDTIYYRRVV